MKRSDSNSNSNSDFKSDPSPLAALSRRDMLRFAACGFGSVALRGLCDGIALPDRRPITSMESRTSHLVPRAKRVIFIFMEGGPSHVDTFDYKPRLWRDHGRSMRFKNARKFANTGEIGEEKILNPLWSFRQFGQSGHPVSSLFPETAGHVDDLCFLHGMNTEGVAHGPSTLFLHTGAVNLVRPSIGSWITYGLGSENQNLPGFVSLHPTSTGGARNYSNAFLPSQFQGTPLRKSGGLDGAATIRHLRNADLSSSQSRRRFQLIQGLNRSQSLEGGAGDELESVMDSFELAYRMQSECPELIDLASEPESVQRLYGIGDGATDAFGRQCLLGRRLSEAGVRYVQINYRGQGSGNAGNWDQHSDMKKHELHARAVDRPIAGLLRDLKQRGLLADTLVWWGGEFGRNPFAQGKDGRDHNPNGFTMWLAGGGVKGGYSHGHTDEFGHYAVSGKTHMHDLHATILYLLGLDHERLTFPYSGRDFRLTDVHGEVVRDVIA